MRGKPGQRFKYRDLGSTATIVRFRAVVTLAPIRLSNLFGWLAWLLVHLPFLTGFKNRGRDHRKLTIAFIDPR